jgi:soluble lytic murein transglycosylase-like protein
MNLKLIYASLMALALAGFTSPAPVLAFASFDGAENWIDLQTATPPATQPEPPTGAADRARGQQGADKDSAAQHTSDLRALVEQHAKANGVPFAIADAVVRVESNYNPRANHAGNMGLMQIRPQTARSEGFQGPAHELLNPDTNLRFAMRYLGAAYRLSGGDVCATLMRYQSGHGSSQMSASNRRYCARARHFMARG